MKTTKYLDADEEKKYYGAEDETIELGACDLQICPIEDLEPQGGNTKTPCLSIWTEWSAWGKCDKECGLWKDYGSRKRTRFIHLPSRIQNIPLRNISLPAIRAQKTKD